MFSSQALVLATAMAVSAGTFIVFKEKYFSNIRQNHPQGKKALKSCLVSKSGKKSTEGQKKKRRVKFAEDVKDSDRNISNYDLLHINFGETQKSCRTEVIETQKMPANHVALYSGILRDRAHRIQYSC